MQAEADHVVWGGAQRQASFSLPHSIGDLHFAAQGEDNAI